MLEWAILILMIAAACAYLARRLWRTLRARSCGGSSKSKPKPVKTDLTVGGRSVR